MTHEDNGRSLAKVNGALMVGMNLLYFRCEVIVMGAGHGRLTL